MPTKAALLRTFRDVVSPSYAEPLERLEEGMGFDPVAGAAATLERTGGAITTNAQAYYLLPHSKQLGPSASGAVAATGAITAQRAGSAAFRVTYPPGTKVTARRRDSRGLWRLERGAYELAEDLVFAEGARAGEVHVRAVRPGEQGNAPPGTLIALELGEGDPEVTCVQIAPITGGRHATLDQLGRERDTPRSAGEPDLDYAYRLSTLPDVVSPGAIDRLCALHLSPLDIGYEILETQTHLPGFVLDHAPLDLGSLREGDPWRGSLLLSTQQSKRFFAVLVEPRPDMGGGSPFDAPNAGINAYDVGDRPGDGAPTDYHAALKGLYKAIEPARAGGVSWELRPRPKPILSSAWTTLYYRDLRTLPSLSLGWSDGELGTFTIDGLDWLMRAGDASLEFIAGAGLRLRSNGRDLTPTDASATAAKILFNSVPGYDPEKATAVLVRFSGEIESEVAAGAISWMGGGDSATVLETFAAIVGNDNARAEWIAGGGPALERQSISHTLDRWVFGTIVAPGTRSRQGVFGPWEDRFPAIEELTLAGGKVFSSGPTGLAGAGASVSAATGQHASFDLTHIAVLQR